MRERTERAMGSPSDRSLEPRRKPAVQAATAPKRKEKTSRLGTVARRIVAGYEGIPKQAGAWGGNPAPAATPVTAAAVGRPVSPPAIASLPRSGRDQRNRCLILPQVRSETGVATHGFGSQVVPLPW